MFKNKTILITGGTGSFGSTFIKKIIKNRYPFKEIRVFSRDEKKQYDLRNSLQNTKVKFYIGDVRDYHAVCESMIDVDYIFHAAALKQVPSCEFFPLEAVKTNILGTSNVLTAADRTKVKKVICLSTDKAVQPINSMGLSKALMEKVVVAKSKNVRKGLSLCITRYGNVIGSRGSVIPRFIEQIKSNKKLTVTDQNMTRFMMSLDEAVSLVIFALKNGQNGEIFIKKSPATSIHILTKAINKFFKKKNNISIIGTREGEKKHEKLLSKEEMSISEDLGDYYKIKPMLNFNQFKNYYTSGKKIDHLKDYSSNNTNQLNENQLLKLLKKNKILK